MNLQELANVVYDTLMQNKQNHQLDIEAIKDQWLNLDSSSPNIVFTYYDENIQESTVFELTIKESPLRVCRWCGGTFDPEDGDYKYLCSADCHHNEQTCQ
jgi:hypothetical protein